MKYWFQDCRAIDYELTHQLLIVKLCRVDAFVRVLSGINDAEVTKVEREPDRGFFDLKVTLRSGHSLWVEVKMWSGLSKQQYDKQVDFIRGRSGDLGIYILLGSSWIERTAEDMQGDPVRWVSYPELSAALERIMRSDFTDILQRELAVIYLEALLTQHEGIRGMYRTLASQPSQLAYYSYFQEMRAHLPDVRTGIYTEHKGTSQHIMHVLDLWLPIELDEGCGHLYLEIIDHEITIRFAHDKGNRSLIRQRLLSHYLPLIQRINPKAHAQGKASKYMRIVRMDLDYKPEMVKENAVILKNWIVCLKEHPMVAGA